MEHYHYKWEQIKVDSSIDSWLDKYTKKYSESSDYGIYQLYGDHPLYGNDVLLYIGKAEIQTFYTRITQHEEWYTNNIKNYTRIILGRVVKLDNANKENWGDVISKTEKLLITAHNPSLNKQEVNKLISHESEEFQVLNWDNYGDLYPEISSYRFSDCFLQVKIPHYCNYFPLPSGEFQCQFYQDFTSSECC